LVSVVGVFIFFSFLFNGKLPKKLAVFVSLILYCFLFYTLNQVQKQNHFSQWPPAKSNWVKTISNYSQIGEDGDFKGKTLVLLNSKSPEQSGWGPFYNICANKIRKKIGSDLLIDLAYENVPLINEHGHFISPPMLSLLCASFYNPKDYVDRAARSPRVFNKTMAQLMGVTTVVTDSPLPGAQLLIQENFNGHEIFLYQIKDSNLGGFSPVEFQTYSDLREFVELVRTKTIDFKKTALVETLIKGDLVPAKLQSLRFKNGPSIRIEAESMGQSLLVLPFDFSYCIQYSGKGNPQIVPVNLSCTGILFRGKIDGWLKFRFSPFANLEQRGRDIQRAKDLEISTTAPGFLFAKP
ncbi:MAG: hypothetical protein EB023_13425, partial [Flavobacteriia bacterium]|nr:hypothetical protein [Flavobacteriia bacterium]